ncbi:porin [Microvirga solisilvae]|uniref:porin n=1 Tax=Microvirga solisilvae TaxID=2919498 RepID=UPI001FAEA270|nr:porin [Microvirga solisilvae]
MRLMIRAILILSIATSLIGGTAQAASPCPPGFAMLQDSSACVRVSGRVRAEAIVGSTRDRRSDAIGTRASGRIRMDVRKQTEYGPLRAVIGVEGIQQ